MMKLEVFDPPMCCSTGTCGPSVDPKLVQFAADLDWLKAQGVEVTRANLSQQPDAFVENQSVLDTLREKGVNQLPFFLVNGRLVGMGSYPSRNQLAQVLNLSAEASSDPHRVDSSPCCGSTGCCS
ncbi:MAG TPA: arsenite efflux transporter metallochaperone ArsD [Planctomycetota bacterium]|nr:arsenite efflux transporter metallochaperone ArsD [Planctomycetota bacterium]